MSSSRAALRRVSIALALLCLAHAGGARLLAQEAPRIGLEGVQLPGNQFRYDAGFEVMDWNGDGKPDLLLPNTSLMSFAVHLNEGTRERPRFGHSVPYPLNLTE